MSSAEKTRPLISVIIATYNEAKVIGDCLQSLKKQTYKPLEIIVVDDGSTDNTAKLLKIIKGVKLMQQNHQGPGAARNKGARRAKGEILVFVDADMSFEKHFLEKLTEPILEGITIGTFSSQEYVTNNDNRWARYWSINQGWEIGRMHPKNYPRTQKVFRAILKREFDRVNGFDTRIGYTDDWSLSEKLKIKAIAAEGAVFYHRNPDNLKEAYQQAKWMAKRTYKLGIIGRLVALIRTSFPVSFLVGTYKSLKYKAAAFLWFKLVIDYAAFSGIISLFYDKQRAR